MVVRRRFRAFLIPLILYVMTGSLVYFFLQQAESGNRGLEVKRQLKVEIAQLDSDLEKIRTERLDWERRIALLRDDQIDRDLLEERARIVLGRVHKNDLVIITNP